jgi:hypothetical protein
MICLAPVLTQPVEAFVDLLEPQAMGEQLVDQQAGTVDLGS